MSRKSVTSERAETWKANERREILVKREYYPRFMEFFYVVYVFSAGVVLMAGYYPMNIIMAYILFLFAALFRSKMFQELRGCSV